MILQALVQYYEALAAQGKIAKPGWGLAKISYALNLDKEGNLLNIIPLKEEQQRGKKTVEIPKNILLPAAVKRSSGIASQFLWDNSSYILGMDSKDTPPSKRTRECFEACRDKHLQLLENVDSDVAAAIKNYFLNWNCETARENEVLKPYLDDMVRSGNITFCVKDKFAYRDDAIKTAWDEYNNYSQKNAEKHRCLVTGTLDTIPTTHPSIKGVRGAHSAGAALISFNKGNRAYESFGHVDDQCLNAPIGAYAVFAYTTALNTLLASEKNKALLGDMTVVYWSEDADENSTDAFGYMTFDERVEIKDKELKELVDAIKGNKAVDLSKLPVNPDNKFYVLGLSPNNARLSVRFFLANTFGNFVRNLQKYYEDISIVKPSYDEKVSISLGRILWEATNKNFEDKATAQLAGDIARSILSGSRYPQSLYQKILLRCKSDQDNKGTGNTKANQDNKKKGSAKSDQNHEQKTIKKINRIKAAVIKACLIRNYNCKEAATMTLNEECNDVAYVLGRLFAVMERIQKEASDTTTIKDKYFNSFCTNPRMIFPALEKMVNYHVRKLSTDIGKTIYFKKLLGELYGKIEIGEHPFPARMTLEDQGKFILGYWHQVQKFYEKRNTEDKENG